MGRDLRTVDRSKPIEWCPSFCRDDFRRTGHDELDFGSYCGVPFKKTNRILILVDQVLL